MTDDSNDAGWVNVQWEEFSMGVRGPGVCVCLCVCAWEVQKDVAAWEREGEEDIGGCVKGCGGRGRVAWEEEFGEVAAVEESITEDKNKEE